MKATLFCTGACAFSVTVCRAGWIRCPASEASTENVRPVL